MLAAVLFAKGDIRPSDWPEPEVTPGTVKVRVRASGICGSDVPRVWGDAAHSYPVVLGHEFAGDVVAVGAGVENLHVGDTVTGAPLLPCLRCADCQRGQYALCKHYSFIGSRQQGSFAEYVVLPARNAVPYDSSIPYRQAAMFEPATVALHAVKLNAARLGATAAVLGGGTVGLFAMQWLKICGAKKVVVFDIDAARLSLAKKLGADETVNTLDPDFMDKAMAYSEGGYGAVFETAGSTATMKMAYALAGSHARVCFVGTPRAPLTFTVSEWENLNRKELNVTGSWMSYSAPFPGDEWSLTAHCFATGQLRFDAALIDREFPLAQATEAFALFAKPGLVHGKVLITND